MKRKACFSSNFLGQVFARDVGSHVYIPNRNQEQWSGWLWRGGGEGDAAGAIGWAEARKGKSVSKVSVLLELTYFKTENIIFPTLLSNNVIKRKKKEISDVVLTIVYKIPSFRDIKWNTLGSQKLISLKRRMDECRHFSQAVDFNIFLPAGNVCGCLSCLFSC